LGVQNILKKENMLRVKHRHQVINQKGREEEKDYLLIRVIEKEKY